VPIYSYRCRQCGLIEEHVVKYADRDKFMQHEGPNGDEGPGYKSVCGGTLERQGVELFRAAKENYQCQAILANGAHIPGHFGKEAKRKRKPKA
jgi:hypothetical protein